MSGYDTLTVKFDEVSFEEKDNLSQNAYLAKQAGMSYGQYQAAKLEYERSLSEQDRLQVEIQKDQKRKLAKGWHKCIICGALFEPKKGVKTCGVICTRKYKAQQRKEATVNDSNGEGH